MLQRRKRSPIACNIFSFVHRRLKFNPDTTNAFWRRATFNCVFYRPIRFLGPGDSIDQRTLRPCHRLLSFDCCGTFEFFDAKESRCNMLFIEILEYYVFMGINCTLKCVSNHVTNLHNFFLKLNRQLRSERHAGIPWICRQREHLHRQGAVHLEQRRRRRVRPAPDAAPRGAQDARHRLLLRGRDGQRHPQSHPSLQQNRTLPPRRKVSLRLIKWQSSYSGPAVTCGVIECRTRFHFLKKKKKVCAKISDNLSTSGTFVRPPAPLIWIANCSSASSDWNRIRLIYKLASASDGRNYADFEMKSAPKSVDWIWHFFFFQIWNYSN